MRVLFMGTPDIAVPCLNALAERHRVVCVVTQPDKPKGRGHKLAAPPVKERALELGIDVCQPTTLKDGQFLQTLEQYRPEVIVVIAYGKILPRYVLDYPEYGCINVHASLLPKYRGAAPIQWAIVNGESVSGVTTMKMEEGLDTGDMLLKAEVPITPTMTGGELHDRLMELCPGVLLDTLDQLNTIQPQKQDDALSCYAPLLTRENSCIDWSQPAEAIVNLIRGMNPFPAAHTSWQGKKVKVFQAKAANGSGAVGEIIGLSGAITVACGDGAVAITKLQLEGKRSMPAKDFLCGCAMKIGERME